ncbi:hypothetical protein [Bacillus sp. UNCCL13]|nr:hypothetical protein [Bacillus sp. UNCCL13]
MKHKLHVVCGYQWERQKKGKIRLIVIQIILGLTESITIKI